MAEIGDEGAFEAFANYKNADGTYNGVMFMSQVSGIPEDEVRRLWEELKAKRNA